MPPIPCRSCSAELAQLSHRKRNIDLARAEPLDDGFVQLISCTDHIRNRHPRLDRKRERRVGKLDDSDDGDDKIYGKAAIATSKNSNAAFDWTAYCLLIARVVRGISIVSDQHKFRFLTFIQVRFS
jgi:hypothetical protein